MKPNPYTCKAEELYNQYKKRRCVIDFDDMLFIASDLLLNDAVFYEEQSSKCDFLQIDEAQDLSELQFK